MNTFGKKTCIERTDVTEGTYGYVFNGIIRDDFAPPDSHTYSGTLSLSEGTVTVLILNYSSSGGVLSGTITGDSVVIDIATVEVPAE